MPGSTTIAARFASRLCWLTVFVLALAASGCEALFGGRPNVVLITLDTTRADHLGCYGYERATSPNLDRLAEASIVYTHMIATSSWTLPAHATLFTGKFTSSHGARYDPEGPLVLSDAIEGPWSIYRARGLGEEGRTLAQVLQEAGYATGAVVGGPWMKRVFGLDRGFDFYEIKESVKKNWERGGYVRGASTITQQLAKNLFLSTEKSITRKIKEAILTYRLERAISKRRILEIYLNVIEWGEDIYGVEAAARTYLGKSAASLDAAEAALLAAMIPSPRRLNPQTNMKALEPRQERILGWMKMAGYLTEEELQEAKKQRVRIRAAPADR